ncbi:TRAFs-binding domain-containing protein [Methylomonas rhizoryzae]|uniref:TRAFs-binding domain-containing protein n=1 Tax=Methylomonas rhizoryzae TaxID=2608981 RepID=UPI001232B6D1|nr:TRAFs-binding domain-containing protein [Methylomonas rhizoryzae]
MTKQCFVVQGFGKKTDYTDGRVLDLNASYEIIKMAVESAGLQCVRADEIVHAGTIDVPMYERLLNADVVIADLSTYNVNAAFELGVRYALKPYTTIVLAEEGFKNPFDLSHIVIRRYKHLGEEIGFREAQKMMAELKAAIQTIAGKPQTDSPVYTYLPQLQPPVATAVVTPAAPAAAAADGGGDSAAGSAKAMLDAAMQKMAASDFVAAKFFWEEVRKVRPADSFVLQQLALATYKSKQPSVVEALHAAQEILRELSPDSSNNPETLGLWGAVHKRLWEECGHPECLAESISAYERGFFLKQDHYNGINLAFLLNLRAVQMLKSGNADEAVADFILAQRIRKQVIRYADKLLDCTEDANKKYWVLASLYEAALGLGDSQAVADWDGKCRAMNVAEWMQDTRVQQADKLQALLSEYAGLRNPAV